MKRYCGFTNSVGDRAVYVKSDKNNVVRPLDPRFDLRRHSPEGFQWGYGGSGPAQLALAILADVVDEKIALDYYQAFKFRVIAGFKENQFELTEQEVVFHVDLIRREDKETKNVR